MIRVLVVDDHELVRKGISRMLSDDLGIQVVGEADSGELAVSLAQKLSPNVVLMDIKMPGIGGIDATKKIVKQIPDIKVLILSTHVEEPFPEILMKAGASGFLSKGAQISEMLTAIYAVNAGQRLLSPELANSLKKDVEPSNPFKKLSERELQIAVMIAECASITEIAKRLSLSPKTVNTYRYRSYAKLGIASDLELARMVSLYGLV